MKLSIQLLVTLLSSSGIWSASLLPSPLPNELTAPSFRVHLAPYGYGNAFYTQLPTTFNGLSTLIDEFSYNCLSGNFELTFKLSNVTANADFELAGTIVPIPPALPPVNGNVTGHVFLNCTTPYLPCLLVGKGWIHKWTQDTPIIQDYQFNQNSVYLANVVEAGVLDGELVEDQEEWFINYYIDGSVQLGGYHGGALNVYRYINEFIFQNLTMTDLAQLTGGHCGVQDQERGSIVPDLPDTIPFEPYHILINESLYGYNMTLDYQRTVQGLSDFENELSYNCLTGSFELSLLFPKLTIEGPFHLEGEAGASVFYHEFNLTGHITEKCAGPGGGVTLDGCLLTNMGFLTVGNDGFMVVDEKFTFKRPFDFSYQVFEGTMDGSMWDDGNVETVTYIQSRLDNFGDLLWEQMGPLLTQYTRDLLESKTIAEVLELTASSCGRGMDDGAH